MAYITLDFLNKNMYRKYPLRATSTHLFTNGGALPQPLITSIQISTVFTQTDIYISKIYAKNGYVSVLLRDVSDGSALGSFSGAVTGQQQVLQLESLVNTMSGSITIGDPAAIDLINGVGYLSTADGRLEESTIFCFTPPGVTSFTHQGVSATGNIIFTGNNVAIAPISPNILLSVIDTTKILSRNDASGVYNNCRTPLIKKINTVTPDSNGNIDVYGISPIIPGATPGTGLISIDTPSLTLPDFCPDKNLLTPPLGDTTDVYYTDILTAVNPEWKGWPQFS